MRQSTSGTKPEAIHFGGLDLSSLDDVTEEERVAFSAFYRGRLGHPHEGFEFMLDHRPDALKRFRLYVHGYEAVEPARPFGFAFLTYYAFTGYITGTRYAIALRQRAGLTKDQMLDAIALAFIKVGPAGAETISKALEGYEWDEPETPLGLPAGWDVGSNLLSSGLDFSNPDFVGDEVDRLFDWYERIPGEVPAYAHLLAKHSPRALKAHRNRIETCFKVLPEQALPYTMLGFETLRGDRHGIRENTLLCRALGVSKEATVGAIVAGMEYGGAENASVAWEAAGDVLDNWNIGGGDRVAT